MSLHHKIKELIARGDVADAVWVLAEQAILILERHHHMAATDDLKSATASVVQAVADLQTRLGNTVSQADAEASVAALTTAAATVNGLAPAAPAPVTPAPVTPPPADTTQTTPPPATPAA